MFSTIITMHDEVQLLTSSKIDYRDTLRLLVDEWVKESPENRSRYKLCVRLGMDSGTLSNVLSKRRHFSIDKLEVVLTEIGARFLLTR